MRATFRGVFAETLGGLHVVRGFAKFSDLAKYSVADHFQREVKPEHQAAIQKFYEHGEYLFFPELVLSLELLVDYDQPGAPANDPLRLVKGRPTVQVEYQWHHHQGYRDQNSDQSQAD